MVALAHPAREPGEDRPQDVPVIRFETDETVVLSDPFLPSSGDVLGGAGGRLRVFVGEADREPLLASLERPAELPVERAIIPHGEP